MLFINRLHGAALRSAENWSVSARRDLAHRPQAFCENIDDTKVDDD